MIRSRILRIVAAGGVAVGALALATPAGADLNPTKDGNQIVSCAGGVTIATLNPTYGSDVAKYLKVVNKSSDGTKIEFLTEVPVPDDSLTCLVDEGIRTNQASQDVKYLLDDQSNSNALLTVTGQSLVLEGSQTATLTGSASCDNAAVAANTPGYVYPAAYPLQGKSTWKFEQTYATGAQIQIQQYIRIGREVGEVDSYKLSATGMVIKGPGIGASISAVFHFWPTNKSTNNAVPCSTGTPGASIAELRVIAADGVDAGTDNDTWDLTIPGL